LIFDVILGDVEDKLDKIHVTLANIEKLLELHLTPPDLKEYKEWKLQKRKGL